MVIENKPDTPPQEEDEEIISEKLTEIKKQIRARGKEKKASEGIDKEDENPPKLRRSSRL